MDRNAYIGGPKKRDYYEWWYFRCNARDAKTREIVPFFFEYYVVNPGLSPGWVISGEDTKPSYCMLKAGMSSKDNSIEINNFFPASDFKASKDRLEVSIGDNKATENNISGRVIDKDSKPGEITWDLHTPGSRQFNIGPAGSIPGFEMYWHVGKMLSGFSGEITYNGRLYKVSERDSRGYQDHNWGKDYANPWIWLNCNNFENSPGTSFVLGGGRVKWQGISLGTRTIAGLFHRGSKYDFNFTKFWRLNRSRIDCGVKEKELYWDIILWNRRNKIEIYAHCPRNLCQFFTYERPSGGKYENLYNSLIGEIKLKLYQRRRGWRLLDTLNGRFAGCEYGRN